VTSGERGINITIIIVVNAIGNNVPPMLIFPRVHFKNHMSTGAPTASIAGANPTVWSHERLFVDCMEHCITRNRPSTEDRVLLVYTIMSPNYKSQPSMWQEKMALSCLHCCTIHHISYCHWTAPSLVDREHMTMLALKTGCCQKQANM